MLFLLYIEETFLYKRKKNIILELEFSYLSDMFYMVDMLYMSYQDDMYYQDDMLLYMYVYDTILSLYTFISMFHVKHSICSAL